MQNVATSRGELPQKELFRKAVYPQSRSKQELESQRNVERDGKWGEKGAARGNMLGKKKREMKK